MRVVCTTPELLTDELKHLREALENSKYPYWAIKRVQNKVLDNNQEDTRATNITTTTVQVKKTMAPQTTVTLPTQQPTTE